MYPLRGSGRVRVEDDPRDAPCRPRYALAECARGGETPGRAVRAPRTGDGDGGGGTRGGAAAREHRAGREGVGRELGDRETAGERGCGDRGALMNLTPTPEFVRINRVREQDGLPRLPSDAELSATLERAGVTHWLGRPCAPAVIPMPSSEGRGRRMVQ